MRALSTFFAAAVFVLCRGDTSFWFLANRNGDVTHATLPTSRISHFTWMQPKRFNGTLHDDGTMEISGPDLPLTTGQRQESKNRIVYNLNSFAGGLFSFSANALKKGESDDAVLAVYGSGRPIIFYYRGVLNLQDSHSGSRGPRDWFRHGGAGSNGTQNGKGRVARNDTRVEGQERRELESNQRGLPPAVHNETNRGNRTHNSTNLPQKVEHWGNTPAQQGRGSAAHSERRGLEENRHGPKEQQSPSHAPNSGTPQDRNESWPRGPRDDNWAQSRSGNQGSLANPGLRPPNGTRNDSWPHGPWSNQSQGRDGYGRGFPGFPNHDETFLPNGTRNSWNRTWPQHEFQGPNGTNRTWPREDQQNRPGQTNGSVRGKGPMSNFREAQTESVLVERGPNNPQLPDGPRSALADQAKGKAQRGKKGSRR